MSDLAATTAVPKPSDRVPIYSINSWWVFSGICFISLFFTWYLQTQVLTDQVYYHSLGARVDSDKLGAFLDMQHRMSTVGYLLVPVILLLKMTLVSFCLLTGLMLTSQKLPFQTIFKIVLFAESAFAASILFKMLLLSFTHEVDRLDQYTNFAPLSLFSLLKASSVPTWLTYPLQTLDVFQVAYCLLLAAGLSFYSRKTFKESFMQVLGSYGAGLLCCMIGFAFLTFSYNL